MKRAGAVALAWVQVGLGTSGDLDGRRYIPLRTGFDSQLRPRRDFSRCQTRLERGVGTRARRGGPR